MGKEGFFMYYIFLLSIEALAISSLNMFFIQKYSSNTSIRGFQSSYPIKQTTPFSGYLIKDPKVIINVVWFNSNQQLFSWTCLIFFFFSLSTAVDRQVEYKGRAQAVVRARRCCCRWQRRVPVLRQSHGYLLRAHDQLRPVRHYQYHEPGPGKLSPLQPTHRHNHRYVH